MKLYLVRHGQTNGNAAGIYQRTSAELSERGHEQSEILAKRFEHIVLDAIIASSSDRAQQTAAKIAAQKQLPIISSDLIVEVRWPSILVGKLKKDPEVTKIREKVEQNWLKQPGNRYEDGESFNDIRGRAVTFLEQIGRNAKNKNILAVSHARFAKMLLAVMIHGKDVDGKSFNDIFYNLSMHNTGITVAEYDAGAWNLVTINDHAHLGEYHHQSEV